MTVIYELEAPDGSILEIEGPDGASEAELQQFAEQAYSQQAGAQQASPASMYGVLNEYGAPRLLPQAAEQPEQPGVIGSAFDRIKQWATAPINQPDPNATPRELSAGYSPLSAPDQLLTGMVTGAVLGIPATIGGALAGIGQEIKQIAQGVPADQRTGAEVAGKVADWVMSGAYQPTNPTAQAVMQVVGKAGEAMIPLGPIAVGPEVAAVGAGLKAVPGLVRGVAQKAAAAVPEIKPSAWTKGAQESAFGAKSVGVGELPLRTAREMKAESLPVKVDLTEGAATRDPMQLAFEKEQIKGPLGAPLRLRAEENNLQIMQNFDSLFDATGAEFVEPVASGNKIVDALSKGYKAAKDQTRAAYKAARNSPEAKAQIDTGQRVIIGAGTEFEQTTSLVDHLNSMPQGVNKVADSARKFAKAMGIADDVEGMLQPKRTTVGKMEEFRQRLNAEIGYDPTDVRQGTIIKKIIDAQTEPVAGPLFKKARTIRQRQARKFEDRAIVARLLNEKRGTADRMVAADNVFNRTILGGSPEEITFVKRVLKTIGDDGDAAWKELQGSTVRWLEDEATKGMGMGADDRPIVSPAKLHQSVRKLDQNGRLDIVFGKQKADVIRDLDDVVRYVNTVPPGTLINNSGTVGTLLAAMGEMGISGTITGIPLPALSILRFIAKEIKSQKIKAKIVKALNQKPKTEGRF